MTLLSIWACPGSAQNGDLMAQRAYLRVLGGCTPGQQPQSGQHLDQDPVRQPNSHRPPINERHKEQVKASDQFSTRTGVSLLVSSDIAEDRLPEPGCFATPVRLEQVPYPGDLPDPEPPLRGGALAAGGEAQVLTSGRTSRSPAGLAGAFRHSGGARPPASVALHTRAANGAVLGVEAWGEGIMPDSASFAEQRSFSRDFESIVTEVLQSRDLREVLDAWPPSVVLRLRHNLLRDEDFLRRMRSVHAAVADRAAQLDELFNEKPVVRAKDLAALREKARARTLALALGLAVAFAVVIPLVLFPAWPALPQMLLMVLLYFGIYRLPFVDQTIAQALPDVLRDRRAWGRRRFRLRAGLTRLRWDWKTTVRDEVVLPEILARINRGAHRAFSHDLKINRPFGARWPRSSLLISTSAVQRLSRELDQTTTGAIALAGRRGVGKTTLLHALANGTLPQAHLGGRLTVVVPAPARYQLREFVLHLHAMVCRAVLEALGNPRISLGAAVTDRWEHHQRIANRRGAWRRASHSMIRSTALLALTVGVSAIWWRQHDLLALPETYLAQISHLWQTVPTEISRASFIWVLALGVQLLISIYALKAGWHALVLTTILTRRPVLSAARRLGNRAIRWAAWWEIERLGSGFRRALGKVRPLLPRALRPKVPPSAELRMRATLTGIERNRLLPEISNSIHALAALATEQLRRIRFLQTHTSGWSGKVDGPRSLGLTVTRSVAHAEQPLTQPEVVDQLREFLQHAATTLIRSGRISGIAIAIDELDKFADPAQAHEFVNEIKTVFGVDNCVFLVSVSDDALASFELRGIPVRDALDSAFTAMITVDPFTLEEACDWLDHRLIGLPSPYACLCYVLSAGIPRELERAAALLVDIAHKDGEPPATSDSPSQLTRVTREIIAADVAAKLRAFSFTVQQHPACDSVSNIIVTLNTVGKLTRPRERGLIPRLDALAKALQGETALTEEPDLTRICHEAAGFCLLSATILEIFDEDLTESALHFLSADALPRLAEARRALAVEPLLTASLVDEIRQVRANLRDN